MLKIDNKWKFDSPGKLSEDLNNAFIQLVNKLAEGEKEVFEKFKRTFASACGQGYYTSSDANWASSDLGSRMSEACDNSATYIKAFYDGWKSLGDKYSPLDINLINRTLSSYKSPYQISEDGTLNISAPIVIPSPKVPKDIFKEAKLTIQKSFEQGDKLLADGHYRQAVQEMLWLLESVATVFEGAVIDGQPIEGKYFNKILETLGRQTQNNILKQVIDWIKRLHGFLSAPAGGGIRHGLHLKEGVISTNNEAILYYNLIKSYTTYLLGEYEKIENKKQNDDDLPF